MQGIAEELLVKRKSKLLACYFKKLHSTMSKEEKSLHLQGKYLLKEAKKKVKAEHLFNKKQSKLLQNYLKILYFNIAKEKKYFEIKIKSAKLEESNARKILD